MCLSGSQDPASPYTPPNNTLGCKPLARGVQGAGSLSLNRSLDRNAPFAWGSPAAWAGGELIGVGRGVLCCCGAVKTSHIFLFHVPGPRSGKTIVGGIVLAQFIPNYRQIVQIHGRIAVYRLLSIASLPSSNLTIPVLFVPS